MPRWTEIDLVPLEGGTLLMGSDEFYADERPVHERRVAPFRIARTPVTNAQFAAFVDDTGYRTVAERALDPKDFPGADPADLVPGSMVFTPTEHPVDLRDWRQWWRWQPGASWRAPSGPGSTIDGLLEHPVVHVSYDDALAFAGWAGMRLPTEAEHEFAARGGHAGRRFAWGDEPYPADGVRANTWLGRFPYDSQGVGGTSPVGSYPPNDFGLLDLIGNVWEWTSDVYAPRHVVPGSRPVDPGHRVDLLGAAEASSEALGERPRRVLKGGSFLCSPDYCLRFRPAARSAQSEDSAMSHIGFRCARDA